jgi:hypothetical protein
MWALITSYEGGVQSWTSPSGGPWSSFDNAARQDGTPTDVWLMICIYAQQGATAAEVPQIIANARAHAPGASIHITGQPLNDAGRTCTLAARAGPSSPTTSRRRRPATRR